jgi:PKD repeat protein
MNDFVDVLDWKVTKLWSPQQFQATATHQSIGIVKNTLVVNKNVSFGGYDWIVLDVQDGQALLLCDKVIEKKRYHSSLAATTWSECELREHLNGSFFDSLGKDRERIIETQVNNPANVWSGTAGGSSTRDRVFLLSLDEVDKYFGNSGEYTDKIRKSWNKDKMKFLQDNDGWYISNKHNKSRIAEYDNGEACWWWLRSPGKNTKHSTAAALVNANGLISVDGNNVNQNAGGVRPALWLKSTL